MIPYFFLIASFFVILKIALYSSVGFSSKFLAKFASSACARTNNQLIAARTSPKSDGSVEVAALAKVSRTSAIVFFSRLLFVMVPNSSWSFNLTQALH